MKKLLFLLVIITACQRDIVPVKSRSASVALTDVNIGTTANDGTGDALRTAFGKVNSNNTLIENAFATVPTVTEMRDAIADTNQYNKEQAIPISTLAFMQADSNSYGGAMTYNGVVNYVAANGGTGGGGGYEWTQFIVGTTTGAPANADTAITIADMAGDVIKLYRGTTADLHKQALNETATNTVTGYRYNSSGQIVVRPAWATGDRAEIYAYPSSGVTKIALTGGESTLLTGLRAGYKFDELSGTQVNGVNGLYTGSTTATVNQTGKFGKAHSFNGSQMSTFGTDVGDLGTSDFSYSAWIYVPTLQSAYNGFFEVQGSASFYSCVDTDNHIRSVITFDDATYINTTSNAAITAGEWVSIIMTYDRDGTSKLYINGTLQTDQENVSAGAAVNIQTALPLRIGRGGNSTWYFNGSIDDVYLWTKVLTQDEVNAILLNSYPW